MQQKDLLLKGSKEELCIRAIRVAPWHWKCHHYVNYESREHISRAGGARKYPHYGQACQSYVQYLLDVKTLARVAYARRSLWSMVQYFFFIFFAGVTYLNAAERTEEVATTISLDIVTRQRAKWFTINKNGRLLVLCVLRAWFSWIFPNNSGLFFFFLCARSSPGKTVY